LTEKGHGMDISAEFKRKLRKCVARVSSYIEIIISVLILFGILVATFNLGVELVGLSKVAIVRPDVTLPIEEYLAAGLQLIIGVEFVKMISKHTVGSTIDVLLFAIARKLVVTHSGALEELLSIIGIAILFIVKYYFGNKCENCPIEPKKLKLNFDKKKKETEE